jgi:hypothetical protein
MSVDERQIAILDRRDAARFGAGAYSQSMINISQSTVT